MKYLTHFFLFALAAMVGAGCTVIRYVKTETDPATGKQTKTEFTYTTPMFMKRDVRDLDILQGKMGGYAGGMDPQTSELVRNVSEGAVQGALKATVKP